VSADRPRDADPETPQQPATDDSPVIPERSRDDSDEGWGGGRDAEDDERFLRERPPHW